ncbi:hypothetical protein Efla_006309 [Eimeria flavescens]
MPPPPWFSGGIAIRRRLRSTRRRRATLKVLAAFSIITISFTLQTLGSPEERSDIPLLDDASILNGVGNEQPSSGESPANNQSATAGGEASPPPSTPPGSSAAEEKTNPSEGVVVSAASEDVPSQPEKEKSDGFVQSIRRHQQPYSPRPAAAEGAAPPKADSTGSPFAPEGEPPVVTTGHPATFDGDAAAQDAQPHPSPSPPPPSFPPPPSGVSDASFPPPPSGVSDAASEESSAMSPQSPEGPSSAASGEEKPLDADARGTSEGVHTPDAAPPPAAPGGPSSPGASDSSAATPEAPVLSGASAAKPSEDSAAFPPAPEASGVGPAGAATGEDEFPPPPPFVFPTETPEPQPPPGAPEGGLPSNPGSGGPPPPPSLSSNPQKLEDAHGASAASTGGAATQPLTPVNSEILAPSDRLKDSSGRCAEALDSFSDEKNALLQKKIETVRARPDAMRFRDFPGAFVKPLDVLNLLNDRRKLLPPMSDLYLQFLQENIEKFRREDPLMPNTLLLNLRLSSITGEESEKKLLILEEMLKSLSKWDFLNHSSSALVAPWRLQTDKFGLVLVQFTQLACKPSLLFLIGLFNCSWGTVKSREDECSFLPGLLLGVKAVLQHKGEFAYACGGGNQRRFSPLHLHGCLPTGHRLSTAFVGEGRGDLQEDNDSSAARVGGASLSGGAQEEGIGSRRFETFRAKAQEKAEFNAVSCHHRLPCVDSAASGRQLLAILFWFSFFFRKQLE